MYWFLYLKILKSIILTKCFQKFHQKTRISRVELIRNRQIEIRRFCRALWPKNQMSLIAVYAIIECFRQIKVENIFDGHHNNFWAINNLRRYKNILHFDHEIRFVLEINR